MANGQPNPQQPQSETAALRAELAKLQEQVAQLLHRQSMPTPDTLFAKAEMKNQAIEAAQEAVAAYIGLPYEQRSQYEANRIFPTGSKIFKVLLGTGKKGENPPLFIRADVESDAKARYQVVCGINHVVPDERHLEFSRWMVVNVTDDQTAKKAVEDKWTYQSAV